MTLSPIAIYTYNRINHLQQTVDSLKANALAKESILIIVSDAAGRKEDEESILKTRTYINSITGFKEVRKEFREVNLGPIGSILEAEKRLTNEFGTLISMEDDNVCAKNFLDFMNQALTFYKNDPGIFSVCGYCPPIVLPNDPKIHESDYFHYHWNLSWGYGLWKDKYNKVLNLKNDYHYLKKTGVLRKINNSGGRYLTDALARDFKYNADFPDAWLGAKATHFNYKSVVPTISKVKNIGSDGSGHHQGVLADKFDVVLDDGKKITFKFGPEPKNNDYFVSKALKFYNGKLSGRILRYMKMYHYALQIKNWLNGR